MRILHFYKTYFPDTFGGVEQFIYQLAEKSAQHGIKAKVLTLSDNPQENIVFQHHEVYQVKLGIQIASNSFSWRMFRAFKALAASADVIHYHYPWPSMDLVHFATRCKKPSVVTYHSDIIRQRRLARLYAPLQRAFLRNVDRIVATSPNYLESSQTLQSYKHKTEVIPIGLDESLSIPADEDTVCKWQKKLPARFFLFVGVLRYYKGLDVLLAAMRQNSCPVVIVGGGPDAQRLRILAQQWNLQHVYFLGELPDQDKNALLSLCYGFVFPSHLRSEAFGISLLEAAMFGKPMISCEIGTGTTFINLHAKTGIVIPPGDAHALSTAMQYLWSDPDAALEMGRAARKRYLQHFTADKMLDAYCKTYRALAQRHATFAI